MIILIFNRPYSMSKYIQYVQQASPNWGIRAANFFRAVNTNLSQLGCRLCPLAPSTFLQLFTDPKIFILKQETPQYYQPSSSFVVTEVDSIHSQQTCTKNYNQTVATFSQTYWPVTAAPAAAAIHIILLASNKQVGSVQDIFDA